MDAEVDVTPFSDGEQYLFADADSTLETAEFVIFGAPFDRTCTHRRGCAHGPTAIRRESYNFETLVFGVDIDLEAVPIYDGGDVEEQATVSGMVDAVRTRAGELISYDVFPILLGGEHSLTEGLLQAVAKRHGALKVLYIDAHLDYRKDYEGESMSHACAARRMASIVGPTNMMAVGTRSFSREERKDAMDDGLRYLDAFSFRKLGPERAARHILEELDLGPSEKLYLSLDMDGIDPAFAPGVGNPEPFGLDPFDLLPLLDGLAPYLAGFDIMEVSPSDNGNTAALAARLVRHVVALVHRDVEGV